MRAGSRHASLVALVAGAAAIGCSAQPVQPAGPRPNVILIVTDDQAFATLPYLPQIRSKLVKRGTIFPNFFLSDPLCCPSRVTMLLGQYRHNHRLESDQDGCAYRFFANRYPRRSIGARLSAAGYRTGLVGKWLNSYDRYLAQFDSPAAAGAALGWDDWHVLTKRTRYYDFLLHEGGELVRQEAVPAVHQTDALAAIATGFIEESAAGGQPFFLFLAPQAPHEPLVPAARHRRMRPKLRAPRGPSFNQPDVASQPSLRSAPLLTPDELEVVDRLFREHVRTLLSVDDMVTAIVDTLDRVGQLDDTFIFYTSDNGYHFGDHRIPRGKGTPFEESIRFPLIVRGPGVAAGVTRSELVSNVDLLPTVLDIVGVEADERIDGRSLLPLLRDPTPPWRTSIVIESTYARHPVDMSPFVGIRTARYKLVAYSFSEPELYDLESDPHETRNVYSETDAAVVDALEQRLEQLLECAGAGCVEVEDAPVSERSVEG